MKLVRFLGVAGLAMAVAPQASAVPLDGSTSTICLVAGSLNSCASVAVSVSGSVLTAVVGNVGGNASYALAGFAFFYTGTSTATGLTLNPSPVLILGNAARDWEMASVWVWPPATMAGRTTSAGPSGTRVVVPAPSAFLRASRPHSSSISRAA